jgi:hypothetical protein
MENDLVSKIKKIVAKNSLIDEDDGRSLMILVRKMLDKMSQSDSNKYLTLRLFCNWVAHIEITNSNTGLRMLSKINDAFVRIKGYTDSMKIREEISNAIGFSTLRVELKSFLNKFEINDTVISNNVNWANFLDNLIEMIRTVPLSFPAISKMDKTKQAIYNEIAKNPIKPGAGVISITISLVVYPSPTDEIMCLTISTEDTTTTIIPLLVDIRL